MSEQAPQNFDEMKQSFEQLAQNPDSGLHESDLARTLASETETGHAHLALIGSGNKERISAEVVDNDNRLAETRMYQNGETESTIVKKMSNGEFRERMTTRPAVARAIASRALKAVSGEVPTDKAA